MAVLFEKTQERVPPIHVINKTDGNGYKDIIAPAGGFRNMYAATNDMEWPDGNIRSLYNTYMKYAVRTIKNQFHPLKIDDSANIKQGEYVIVRTDKGEEVFRVFIVCYNSMIWLILYKPAQ